MNDRFYAQRSQHGEFKDMLPYRTRMKDNKSSGRILAAIMLFTGLSFAVLIVHGQLSGFAPVLDNNCVTVSPEVCTAAWRNIYWYANPDDSCNMERRTSWVHKADVGCSNVINVCEDADTNPTNVYNFGIVTPAVLCGPDIGGTGIWQGVINKNGNLYCSGVGPVATNDFVFEYVPYP